MFTGIIEALGKVEQLSREGSNLHITVSAPFTDEIKIDQSIAHNGVCLTVVDIHEKSYTVTAIDETLKKTNLGVLKTGDVVNLERCMKLGDRLDGHIVQGHVDQTATCIDVEEQDGSWIYSFSYSMDSGNITVPKGSICINGVSLTVVESEAGGFSVAIIPYTYSHTNFQFLKKGHIVNLEFDVIGKYVAALMKR
ncbi:MAG: riboflavin synthase [Bacteroidia bacterium]